MQPAPLLDCLLAGGGGGVGGECAVGNVGNAKRTASSTSFLLTRPADLATPAALANCSAGKALGCLGSGS